MAATPSYFLLLLPRSKQAQGPAKERDHSEVVSAWMVIPFMLPPPESAPVSQWSTREGFVDLSAISGGSVAQNSGFSRCQRSDLVEKSLQ